MSRTRRVAIVGGGPAGLMAAEVARAGGLAVDLYEAKGSVGRKFLVAGKGGLNLTHGEPFDDFAQRYQPVEPVIDWLRRFDANALRGWARGLGVDTFVGSSGRVFPADQKAAPLLRAWVRRLREQGVCFHVQHRCTGIGEQQLTFETPDGIAHVDFDAAIFAMGGGSWPVLGSDGAWQQWLGDADIAISPLRPSNCGFEVAWSSHFAERYAGNPIKPVRLGICDGNQWSWRQGELIASGYGLEGGLIYALSAPLREQIGRNGHTRICLDLMPNRSEQQLVEKLQKPHGKRSLSEHLRRTLSLSGVRLGLLREVLQPDEMSNHALLARTLKALPLRLNATRPLAEAISSAGGICFRTLDPKLMLHDRPGVFFAGEMLDWEAPTGGYLLTACFASGHLAGNGAVDWLRQRR